MGNQRYHIRNSYSFFFSFFSLFFPTYGRNMKVILFFLLVIIASARVGNAWITNTWSGTMLGAGVRVNSTHPISQLNGMRRQKVSTPDFPKAKRWAKNEETQKIRANLSPAFTMEKNMAKNTAKNMAMNTAKNMEKN